LSLSSNNESDDGLAHLGFGHSEHDLKVIIHFVPSGHEGHVIGTSSHDTHVDAFPSCAVTGAVLMSITAIHTNQTSIDNFIFDIENIFCNLFIFL